MHLNIKATNIELTAPLKEYVEKKIGSLDRFVKRWEAEGEVEAWIEVGRTTRHHHKGDVFRAEVDVRLPHKILRVEDRDYDLRVAIDRVRDKLFREIETYKAKAETKRRATKT